MSEPETFTLCSGHKDQIQQSRKRIIMLSGQVVLEKPLKTLISTFLQINTSRLLTVLNQIQGACC